MVQIGNYHIGKADTATEPRIDVGEAALIWDLLVARYQCVEETQIYHNFAHDSELRVLMQDVGIGLLERQVKELEEHLNKYQVPLPKRPPKTYNLRDGSEFMTDEFMFIKIFTGCQIFIDCLARAIRSTVTNDALRSVFVKFLKDEIPLFDRLCKYGKQKGWLEPPPMFKPH